MPISQNAHLHEAAVQALLDGRQRVGERGGGGREVRGGRERNRGKREEGGGGERDSIEEQESNKKPLSFTYFAKLKEWRRKREREDFPSTPHH